MITFYADSINEAYKKMQNDEWKNDILEYITELNGVVDGQKLDAHNLLSLFELDAYDIYITWEDVMYQTSRLASAFKSFILEQFEGSMKDKIEDSKYNQRIMKKSFAQNLRILRSSKHLTQDRLSEMTNISIAAIMAYENQRRSPTGKNLCILARFFNVDPIDLLGTDID